MTTRNQILKMYDVDTNGVIQSPGKFEGEMLYVPYFWLAYLDGGADDDDGEYLRFDVNADDVALFPELEGIGLVALSEDSQGFVHASTSRK